MWDDGTAPMVVRNVSSNLITVCQKGFPAHKQVVHPGMQVHFVWSAVQGEDSEFIVVEGCTEMEFSFAQKIAYGKLRDSKAVHKIKCSTSVENGVNVMTFLDERLISAQIATNSVINFNPDVTYMNFSICVNGVSVQL